jgi:hypothetical protein
MSDDRDDEQASGEDTLPPFVQVEDSSHLMAAAHARLAGLRANAVLSINDQSPLSLAGKVRYVDFGFSSAREYWAEVAEPAYERFLQDESRGNAITAFLVLWPLHDWLWHEQHPGEDTRNSKAYEQFREQLFTNCRARAGANRHSRPIEFAT